jgi:beta-lactamase superfamily II metal-dependent hydrolase
MRVHPTDLLFAAIWCVFMYFHSAIPKLILHPRVQSKPTVKAAKEGAFKESVEWLIKYLQQRGIRVLDVIVISSA